MTVQAAQRIIETLKLKNNRYVFYQNEEDRQENKLCITRAIDHTLLTIRLDDYAKFNSYGDLDINETAAYILKMINKAFKNMPSTYKHKSEMFMHIFVFAIILRLLFDKIFETIEFLGILK